MKKPLYIVLFLFFAIATDAVRASVYYWDPEGTATPTGATLAGTWDSSAEWSTSSAQSASPRAFSSGVAAGFAAGSTTVTTPFTVTVDSPVSIAGIFNGTLTPPGVFVTFSGAGSFNIVSGADAFATGGSDGGTTTINIPITGSGQIALEGSSKIYFNGTNTFTGGVSIGYVGVTAYTGTAFFNNGGAFGSGTMTMTTAGNNGSLQVEGTAPITLPNTFIAAAANLNLVGNPAGLTLSGPWDLSATPAIGTGGSGNLVTISGVMSGAGGLIKYNPSTLVLSGVNTYTGVTTISNGILSITDDDNLGAAPTIANYNITLSGGTLNASNTFTINPKRLILLTAGSSISVSPGQTLSYGGNITGSANLTKTGTGTVVLTGANGYTGSTQISAGVVEADSQSGSLGTNNITISAAGTMTGNGLIGGPVTCIGTIAPGTPDGPATLTFGNGLNMSLNGTYQWTLAENSTAHSYSSIDLIHGNLNAGGTSKLQLNFTGSATTPNTNDAFWQTQEAWTVASIDGSASNSTSAKFTILSNAIFAAGNFSTYLYGNGNVVLLYQPNFAVFDALYDSGFGFFGGENLIFTNFSGLNLSAWSSTDPGLSVSNWTLVGQMDEQNLAPELPGYSRYTINANPSASPTYYVAGNMNSGPYIYSPADVTILTTVDYNSFTVSSTNVGISSSGVFALQPAASAILSGAGYSGGQLQFQFSADVGQNYTVQGSTNLMTWTNISSGVVSNSPQTFTDPAATNYRAQFYRVIIP